jgi:hypothetical protein
MPSVIADAEKEMIVSTKVQDEARRAEASIKKEERAREGAAAMLAYETEGRAVLEKTARLRALRLAREADGKIKPAVPSTPSRSKRVKKVAINENDDGC